MSENTEFLGPLATQSKIFATCFHAGSRESPAEQKNPNPSRILFSRKWYTENGDLGCH